MANLSEFLAVQGAIYNRFEIQQETVRKEGVSPDKAATDLVGGFLVVWKHSPRTSKAAAELSRTISDVVPALLYPEEGIHTTVSDYQVVPGLVVDRTNPAHEDALSKLAQGVREALMEISLPEPCAINYIGWLYNATTVIAEGIPNSSLISVNEAIQNACARHSIELRAPWGAHITVSRFLEKVPADRLPDLFQLLNSARPLGMSRPVAVEVGYFRISPAQFEYFPYGICPL